MTQVGEAAATTLGFIGLGTMGAGIVQRLSDCGFPVKVWARRREVINHYAARGFATAASVADLGAACDHVGICVLDDAAVATICEELIPAMRPGSLLAIHSTILPASCEALERRCDERGVLFVDAPVDGSGEQAARGEVLVICGGRPHACERARPVLEAMGRTLVPLGGAGDAQRAKIINNSLLSASLGLARAAMNLADRFGLNRARLSEVVRGGAGQSNGFELYPQIVEAYASRPPGVRRTPMLHKDLGLLMASAGPCEDSEVIVRAAGYWLDGDEPG